MSSKTWGNTQNFLTKNIEQNLAALALDFGFTKCDTMSQIALGDLVKHKISSIISNIKSNTELNGRTDSNLIDTMTAITYYEKTTK